METRLCVHVSLEEGVRSTGEGTKTRQAQQPTKGAGLDSSHHA